MKKFLSLVLALIMVMSLVTVGAGAAFTDADAIDVKYTEAVDLMYALEIVSGYDDGSFNPKGVLSRGAAAKIIANIALGVTDAKALSGDELPFTDVTATSSMRPFIAWAYEQGIIKGYDATTFGPKVNVTGHAFLKMVLGALKIDGVYEGSNWRRNVELAATKANLLKGITITSEELKLDLTRELACQIAFNAMVNYDAGDLNGDTDKVDTVTYYTIGGMTFDADELVDAAMYKAMMGLNEDIVTITKQEGKLIDNVHKVKSVTGVITTNSANASTKLTTIGGLNYAVDTKLAQLGNTVTVYYKDATTAAPYDATKGYTVYSVADACTEITIKKTNTAKEIKEILAAAGITTDAKASAASGTVVNASGAVSTGSISITVGTTKGSDLMSSVDSLNLIVKDKQVIGYKMPLPKFLSQVTDLKTEKDKATITLKGYNSNAAINNGYKSGETILDVVNEYEGIAKEDYVIVTQIGTIYNVEKAETVTGKPSKIDGTKLTIDGVEYTKSTNNKTTLTDKATITLKDELVLFLDGQGNYIVAKTPDGEKANTDIVYVAGVYKVTAAASAGSPNEFGVTTGDNLEYNTYFAQAVTLAGVEVRYQITKAQYDALKSAGDNTDTGVNKLFKLTEGTEKTKDTAELIKAGATADKNKYVEAKFATFTASDAADELKAATSRVPADLKDTAVKLNATDYYAENVVFVYIYGDKDKLEVTVKDGAQKLTGGADVRYEVVYEAEENGLNTIHFVIVEAKFAAETIYTGDVVYVKAESDSTKQVAIYVDPADSKEKVAYEHEVYVNGVKTTVALVEAQKENVAAGFYKMTEIVEGVYKLETGLTNVVTGTKMTTLYKGLASFNTGVTASDIATAGAQIVDLVNTTGDSKITDITKITSTMTLAVVLEKAATSTTNSVVTIYITAK